MSKSFPSRFAVKGVLPVALIAAAGLSAAAIGQRAENDSRLLTEPAPAPASVERAIEQAESLSDAFAYAAEVISPSLVHISVEREFTLSGGDGSRGLQPQRRPAPRMPRNLPPEFEDFFGEFFDSPRMQPRGPQGPRSFSRDGLGSGVIVSKGGHIITNHHVVAVGGPAINPNFERSNGGFEDGEGFYRRANAQLSIEVTLHDGAVREAELVASDPEADIAVLKLVDVSGVTPARFGDSEGLRIGEWVVAAGSPFGLGRSITSGIVSATGRSGVGLNQLESYIQTDAAINPGNSGGPLVNLRGEIVGINTAIASRGGGFNGVGFAIPANLVRLTYEDLVEDGVTDRPFLGVSGQELTPELAESFGLDRARGALVVQVTEDSAASAAGFEAGDVILEVNGRAVRDFDGLRFLLAQYGVGDEVRFTVFRDGTEVELEATLRARPGAQRLAEAFGGASPEAPDALGMTVEANADGPGVVVVEVRPGSAAGRLGVAPGTVVLEVQGRRIGSVEDWNEAVSAIGESGGVRLLVATPNGARRFLFLRRR